MLWRAAHVSCAAVWFFNRFEAAPSAFYVAIGGGHACISCPYPDRCLHNSLWPKNDWPNMAFSLNFKTDGISALRFDLSIVPIAKLSIPLAEPSIPSERDPAARSAPQLRRLQDLIWSLCGGFRRFFYWPRKNAELILGAAK